VGEKEGGGFKVGNFKGGPSIRKGRREDMKKRQGRRGKCETNAKQSWDDLKPRQGVGTKSKQKKAHA